MTVNLEARAHELIIHELNDGTKPDDVQRKLKMEGLADTHVADKLEQYAQAYKQPDLE